MTEEMLESTYGKGYKMLQKCGFKVGQGLGINHQGTTELINLARRKKNEGLSFSKPEIIPLEKPSEYKNLPEWLFSNSYPKKKRKLSPECIKSELRKLMETDPMLLEKVALMKQTYEETITNQEVSGNSWDYLNVSYENTRYTVIGAERKIQIQTDFLVSLAYEEKQVKINLDSLEKEKEEISQLEKFMKNKIYDLKNNDLLLENLKEIEENFPKLWADMRLKERYGIPLCKKYFSSVYKNWIFENEPMKGYSQMKIWKEWVGEDFEESIGDWEVGIMRFLNGRWKIKEENGKNVDYLEKWMSILPENTKEKVKRWLLNIFTKEFEKWEPRQDRIPIHTWVHPWLPLVDLSSLWPTLVRKLSLALQDWHPQDPSAKIVLSPWKPVLGSFWTKMMIRYILPKLVFILQELPFDLTNQDIEPLTWVMSWKELISDEQLSKALETEFYPRWKAALRKWVENAEDDDMENISIWYEEWQKIIPKTLLDLENAFNN
ncbi:unnamed protein product [Blepharisma stoltei]|uniref:G-patch domain-containing protein n=1 Tax=Blepharisma stoltei TaxID=1481888 RepID=A0AAU9JGD9_9CILI|nr:unnamed protein product [Blepharisma stoltei]